MNCPANFFDKLMEEYRNKDGYNDELLEKGGAIETNF